jgi:hypothetical protein
MRLLFLCAWLSGCDAAADPCTPTDAPGPSHAPSEYRGLAVSSTGGGMYDPRLSGCTWSSGMADISYDSSGRVYSVLGIDGGAEYTWSDDGCLERIEAWGNSRSVTTRTCDNHGYVICEEKYGVVTTSTNRYVDDQLAEVVRDGTTWLYTWLDDHVATIQSGESVTTFVWEEETLVSTERRVAGELVSGWTATLDERGRVVVGTSLDGEVYTYAYETDAEWPVTILDSAGAERAAYWASCPSD